MRVPSLPLAGSLALLWGTAALAATTPNTGVAPVWPNRGLVQFLPATSTASSIAAGTSTSVTGSISGNTLTVSAVGSGTLVVGATLAGTGIQVGTQIINQLNGTAGGVGVYSLSVGGQSIASETITATYGVLTVGGTVTGSYRVGSVISGTGIAAGDYITQLGTGSGGAGTYYVTNSQTVASEAINADQAGSFKTLYTVGWGNPSGINGSVCNSIWTTNTDASATHLVTLYTTYAGVPFVDVSLLTIVSVTPALGISGVSPQSFTASTVWPLPQDSNQNPYDTLIYGDSYQVTYATAITSGANIVVGAKCSDY